MYDVFKVVNWLRARNAAEMRENPNAEELTQMKAMKLLYYVQAANLVVTGHRLFKDDLLAWKYGPVVEAVHERYRGQREIGGQIDQKTLKDFQELENAGRTADVLNSIYATYGHSSASDLMRQTHQERPWQETKQSQPISDQSIIDYYSKVFTVVD